MASTQCSVAHSVFCKLFRSLTPSHRLFSYRTLPLFAGWGQLKLTDLENRISRLSGKVIRLKIENEALILLPLIHQRTNKSRCNLN